MGGRSLQLDPERRAELEQTAGRCEFPAGALRCGVSGGADSGALLILARVAGHPVTAVHVDHGLRTDSHADAEQVSRLAEQWGAGIEVHEVTVGPGPNVEARARRARWAVLGPDAVVGHTADDQAETVLLALLRGAGVDGLAGMSPARHPLLGLRRRDTESVCALAGYQPVVDRTNRDPAHLRNRVRHELIPLLADISGRDPVPVLCRQADLLAAERDHLDAASENLDVTSPGELAGAPAVLARRAVRRWLRAMDAEGHPPDGAAVERVLAVARREANATHVTGGVEIRRSGGRLTAAPAPRPRP